MKQVKEYRIVLVSPGDVMEERSAVAAVVEETNRVMSPSQNTRVQLWRWETDAHPGFHAEGPQGLIDQLARIEDSDLVVGVFWKRFGTPTLGSESGTEHELVKAWDSWNENGHPQVMVYFNETPYFPKSKEETDQWGRVLEFRKNYPKKGMWKPYGDADQFKSLFREHLLSILLGPDHSGPRAGDDGHGYLDPPVFEDMIPRADLLTDLEVLMQDHPVVSVGGLSGSGKTYLAAAYVAKHRSSLDAGPVLWYDPVPGESVDSLLAQLALEFPLKGSSTVSRCKELVRALGDQRALLVIDDYQKVDQATYSLVVELGTRRGGQCCILLLSQIRVELLGTAQDPPHLGIEGFDSDDTRRFLARRGFDDFHEELVQSIVAKTGGLPFAVSLFSVLVKEFGWDPMELLSGAMTKERRVRLWFQNIVSSLGPDERRLLHYLSLSDGPFNIKVVRLLSKHIGMGAMEAGFLELQRRYLVHRYTRYRWKIHDFVARLCLSGLDRDEQETIHSMYGHHFLRGLPRDRRRLSDDVFLWKVRACRHLQRNPADYRVAEKVLLELAATAKYCGHYALYAELSGDFLSKHAPCSGWVDYHHYHCCYVLGRMTYCLNAIENLVYNNEEEADALLRLAVTRLYAEVLASTGHENAALDILIPEIEACPVAEAVVVAQAKSAVAWLYTLAGDFEKAEDVCNDLLAEAGRAGRVRSGAVAMTRKGVVRLLTKSTVDARDILTEAAKLFRRCGDRRGLSWACVNLAECQIDLGDEDAGLKELAEAQRITSDIGECGIDLRNSLARMKDKAVNQELQGLIQREMERISLASALALR